ncbi:4-hydroxy-tetrahydrodipicolinate reductase [Archaeoglobus veneficus]|uniref:4-hydroxy-tetrahydrodipicolinate reductase n=1 Tax=Archaeoglobus veneficus (strain DSM 11195 / SNP6) TaxID=693661 RepID=F2KRR5_ARCVS|nr:4-hydroxy-tetrahydrodipicolinate reductase [Archaeoglobus veneficus]AEA47929.1 Dihydrodipicolinate reductase [Archaeoglobus veneficus SNP6]
MIRVAVAGAAGRMGRLIIKNVVEDKELELAQAFDVREVGKDAGELAGVGKTGVSVIHASEMEEKLDADVLVDFTTASAAVENIRIASQKGVKLVVGTTGFTEEQKKQIEEYCKAVPAVVSPNFSVGVNVFWKLLEAAASYLSNYDVEIVEIHHRFKRDAPSGTAVKAAEVIKSVIGEREVVTGRSGECPRSDEIGVFAVRGGDVVGEHTVFFIGMGERVEITHRAWSRQAFAGGAIKAVKWIAGINKPGIYGMADVLGL